MIGYLRIHLVCDKLQLVLDISFSSFVLPEQVDSTRKKKWKLKALAATSLAVVAFLFFSTRKTDLKT